MRAALGVCAVLAAAPAATADVLYTVNGRGLLRAADPATGIVSGRLQLAAPGKVVTAARGLGAAPGGAAYALVVLGETCALDPTRTEFVGTSDEGCVYYGGTTRENCEQSFVVTWDGQPRSCTWAGSCELCMGCLNTCAPPPPCAGSSRTQYAGVGSEACRRFDGDSSGCAAAYFSEELGIGNTATFACYESADQCLGCTAEAQAVAGCSYDCQPSATCADGERDLFTGAYGCVRLYDVADACQRAFQTDGNARAMACVVGSDGYCTGCDPNAEALGYCTNTCEVAPACADAARAAVPTCYVRDGDPDGCAQAYTTGTAGEPLACRLNENAACVPCDRRAERDGTCINGCAPPVCGADPQRTTVLEPPAGCHVLDGDPGACAAAYFVGPCGVSSCHYDADSSLCRPCTLEDPERCENACGSFETTDAAWAPALATVDLGTGQATVVGSPSDWLVQPAPDATGTIYALGGNGCVRNGILRLDPSDLRPSLVAPITDLGGGALAVHPSGQLYRFHLGTLFMTDPASGLTTSIATDAPIWFQPAAMTWAPACDAFLVADVYDGLWRLDRVAGTVVKTVLRLEGECDEGDCTQGLVLDGSAVCPPLTFPTFTTTTTSTSTSSSTSTTTLPSELVTGRRLLLTDDARPNKRRFALRSDDPAISLGAGESSADDPVVHGGMLTVVASTGSFEVTYALAGRWRYVRKNGRLAGYAWSSPDAIRRVVLRRGRLDVRGQGGGLVQTLFNDPGDLQVVLQLGGRRWCLEFGGTFDARTPRKLRAHDAPAPADCVQP